MPYATSHPSDERFVRIVFTGIVTGPDLASVFDQLCRMGGRSGLNALWDYRAVTAIDVQPDDLPMVCNALVRYDACIGPGRAAWVVATTYGDAHLITSMLAAKAHHPSRMRRGFTSYDEAVAWISEGATGT